jgi:hypothetical protein
MRKIMVATAVVALLLVALGGPVAANEGASVYVDKAHDDLWGFNFWHVNPCNDESAVIDWWAEHRNTSVDHDGDWATAGDRHKSVGVMVPLSMNHSQDGWEVVWAGDSLNQSGWDEITRFEDEDQATVLYRVRVKAENPETGEWYQMRQMLRYVSSGQGTTIHGVEITTNHTTGCHVSGGNS